MSSGINLRVRGDVCGLVEPAKKGSQTSVYGDEPRYLATDQKRLRLSVAASRIEPSVIGMSKDCPSFRTVLGCQFLIEPKMWSHGILNGDISKDFSHESSAARVFEGRCVGSVRPLAGATGGL